MSIIEEKWEEIIDLLCTDYSVSYLSYQTWLKPMKVKDFHGNTLTISTGKEEGVAFISRKYRKQIETSVRDVTGIECEVVFESEGGTEDGSSLSNKAVDPVVIVIAGRVIRQAILCFGKESPHRLNFAFFYQSAASSDDQKTLIIPLFQFIQCPDPGTDFG